MLKRMEDCGLPLDESALNKLELQLKCSLPKSYREFLRIHNGGHPVPDVFLIHGLENNPIGAVQYLFGFGTESESYDLVWNRKSCNELIGSDYLPIGCTGTNDIICISIGNKNPGGVYFWLFSVEYDEHGRRVGSPEDNLYFVAKSFEEFLANLQEEPEELPPE